MKLSTILVVVGLGVAASATAIAQDFDDSWENDDPFEEPAPAPEPPPPPPPPAPPPVVAEPAPAPAAESDFETTVGSLGFQVARIEGSGLPITASIPMLGVRKWSSLDAGWEAGGTLVLLADGASDQKLMILGGTFGLLRALSVHRHMAVFWEPQATLLLLLPDTPGFEDDALFVVDGRLNIGAEVRLGFIGLPQLGLTTRLAAGIRLVHDGDDTDLSFGTGSAFSGVFGAFGDSFGPSAASVRGLLQATVGFVFYL